MRTALVTGATSGLGWATALKLGELGWWVLASGMDTARGAQIEKELATMSGGRFVAGDITESDTPQHLIESATAETGNLDLLVNNAGIHFLADLTAMDLDAFDRLMDVNLRAAVLLAKEALSIMLEQGSGTIINVSSEAGMVAVPNQVAYNISKAGMIMLTRSIAADFAHTGIRAVSVCPGTTRTAMVEEAIASADDPPAHERTLASMRPANRLGKPEEIAEAIAFVASDRVSYLNGTEVVVDGGFTII